MMKVTGNQHLFFPVLKGNLLILILVVLTLFMGGYVSAREQGKIIRLVKLQIDSTQLQNYKIALQEEIETSIRVEPGVLTLYAVSDRANPTQITIFEVYANVDAYNSHRESPHFKKYKSLTKEMVKSLDLNEAVPILLKSKAGSN